MPALVAGIDVLGVVRKERRRWLGRQPVGSPMTGSASTEKFLGSDTIDLQWEIRANYNATPWKGERKAAGAETMDNNARNNRNSRKSGRVLTPGCGAARQAAVLRSGFVRKDDG